MLTKIKWFFKGAYACSNIVLLLTLILVIDENKKLQNNNKDEHSHSEKKCVSKCPKGKPVSKPKPRYPIGFAPPEESID